MAGISIRDLGEFSWGARVDGVTWDNISDPDLRAQLFQLFEDRGLLIFENMEPSSKMQVELSKVFGPLKDHPTKAVPRAVGDIEPGVIDMHYPAGGVGGHAARRPDREWPAAGGIFPLALRPYLQR